MSDAAQPVARDTWIGLAGIVGACVVWGLSPIFYKLVAHVPPGEVLAHRTFWSAVLFAGILGAQGRMGPVLGLVTGPMRWRVLAASVLVTINWGVFIFAVRAGRVVESAMGYYIVPLVSVGLGALIFRERLSRAQVLAIAMAVAGVLTLLFGLGIVPVISLILALTFGTYGALKKALEAGAVASVTAEVLLIAPFSLAWLIFAVPGMGAFRGIDAVLLLTTGPLTAIPLIFFAVSARRLNLATVGVVQYLNPSLQFLCATVIFGEIFTPWHAVAFGLIWSALVLYSSEAFRWRGRARAPASPPRHPPQV